MDMKPITSIIVLFTLLSSGCLGIIDDINDDLDQALDKSSKDNLKAVS